MPSEKNEEETFCPKVEPINNNLKELSYDEKLKHVKDEAQSLYAFCLQKGFTQAEIHSCVSKLRGPEKPKATKALHDSSRSFLYLSIVVAIAAYGWASPKAYNLLTVHAKIGAIKFVLPYWDWAKLYTEDCVIPNYYLPEQIQKIDKKFCSYCTNVVKYGNNVIDRLNNTNGNEITTHYIQNGQPVVVTDATKNWELKKTLTMDEIARLYQTDQLLSTSMGSCFYSTNVGFNETFYNFISAYVDQKLPEKWHANWINCDPKSAKVLRKYYARPYYLPGMAQAAEENGIIAAKGSQANEHFNISIPGGMSGHWLTIVSGTLNIKLSPYPECIEKFDCKIAELMLYPGETVFFTENHWTLEYSVVDDGITLAITSAVIWDDM